MGCLRGLRRNGPGRALLRGFLHTHTPAFMEPPARTRIWGKKVLRELHLSLKHRREPTSSEPEGQCVTPTRQSNGGDKFFPQRVPF